MGINVWEEDSTHFYTAEYLLKYEPTQRASARDHKLLIEDKFDEKTSTITSASIS